VKNNLRAALTKQARAPNAGRLRIALVRLACVGLATYVSWPLIDIEPPRKAPELLKPVVHRVRIHAPVRKVQEKKREQIIIRSETAPKKPIAPKKQKAVEAPLPPTPEPEPITELPPEPLPPPPQEIPKLAFPQPGLPALPPAPPDDLPRPTHFQDKSGGSVVVIAVQLNSDNIVVLSDILVESNKPFNDLALAMGMKGVKWKDVDPPIPPGELRWVEVRVDYAEGAEKQNVLP
jgi:hypothetical protein